MACIHIGTSGWHYKSWIGPFYPSGIKPREFLTFYARKFHAVEINSTFYRLPSAHAVAEWRDASPPGMIFACKASRFITHMKKLKDPEGGFARFFTAVETLRDKAGPVLFQLPPHWHVDVPRLRGFLEGLPAGRRYAFEFRDTSWFSEEVYDTLARHKAACCAYDLAGRVSPVEHTADFAYVRLHGPGGPYQGSYDSRTLSAWARRLLAWRRAGRDVYCFFDNDQCGYAAQNALQLQDKIAQSGGKLRESSAAAFATTSAHSQD